MFEQKQRRKAPIVGIVVVLIAAIITGLLVVYRQQVVDTVRAMQFTPSAEVASIRDDLKLTQLGRLYFDSSQPVVASAGVFNQHCPHSEPNNPVLGCYTNQEIYVYDVMNKKLDGIEETTAAHELLHAAYERMSDAERAEIDAELEKTYKIVKTDELEARMEYYEKNEPGEEANELHSILGTEFVQLSPELELHYAKYFSDRTNVVSYYQQYQSEFTAITTKLDSLAEEINSRTREVKGEIAQFKQDQSSYENEVKVFNKSSSSYSPEQTAKYNELKARQDQFIQRQESINNEIAAINKLRKKYDTLRREYEELAQSINSSLDATPALEG